MPSQMLRQPRQRRRRWPLCRWVAVIPVDSAGGSLMLKLAETAKTEEDPTATVQVGGGSVR